MSGATGGRWRIWLKAILAAGCGLGCRGLLGHQAIPEDPLFVTRKPVEAKALTAAPVALAFVEPPLPADPNTALASAKETLSAPQKTGPVPSNVPGILTSQPGPRKTERKRDGEKERRREKQAQEPRAVDGPYLPPFNPR